MYNELVSVIIPIYNAEQYIENLFANIIQQTYRPIELILVNDGSKDQSQELIERCFAAHKEEPMFQINVCNKENGGIASARNMGMLKASGKYIIFMDQDDWLEKDCIEKLVQAAIEKNADLVIGGFNKIGEDGEILDTWKLDSKLSWSKYRITAPWGRIFKKSVIDRENLQFYNTKISEDLFFNLLFMSYTERIDVIPYAGYNWLQSNNSESHANWSRMTDDRNPIKMLVELHKKMGSCSGMQEDELTFFFSKYIVWYLLFCGRGAERNQLKLRTDEAFEWLNKNYSQCYKFIWKSYIFPKGESLKVRLCVSNILLMQKMGILSFFLELYRRVHVS